MLMLRYLEVLRIELSSCACEPPTHLTLWLLVQATIQTILDKRKYASQAKRAGRAAKNS
jgi:hypothetical protein